MGYVWCDGYVWDMCGVRYANNLLKNPATKRLSGKKRIDAENAAKAAELAAVSCLSFPSFIFSFPIPYHDIVFNCFQ